MAIAARPPPDGVEDTRSGPVSLPRGVIVSYRKKARFVGEDWEVHPKLLSIFSPRPGDA